MGARILTIDKVFEMGIPTVIAEMRATVGDRPVYVSLDIDSVDPAFAPGVSHREPGGASTRQLIEAIQGLRGNVVGADVVEFNPRQDPVGVTAPVAAKIVKELAARMILS